MSARATLDGRIATIVLLAAWLGAATLVGAVVAPAAFAVLPTRTLAGALVGRVLPTLFWSGALFGVVAAVAAGRGRRAALLASAAIVLPCLLAQLAVAPRIEQVRVSAGGPIDALARDDARRVAFGRLHAASVALLGVAGIAAAVTLVLAARTAPERSTLTLHESHDDG